MIRFKSPRPNNPHRTLHPRTSPRTHSLPARKDKRGVQSQDVRLRGAARRGAGEGGGRARGEEGGEEEGEGEGAC